MYNQITANKRKSWLLITIFIAFIVFLGWILGESSGYGYGGLVFALFFSTISAAFSYYSGDKVALWTSGAQAVSKEDNAYLYRIVENLCITAGIPMPKVHIISDPGINAFATGRDPEHASIAVTTGAIEKLENEELEGVIAHELSHIKNFDIRIMTIVIVLVGTIALLSNFFLRARFFGGFRRRSNDRESGQVAILFMVIGLLFAIISPLIAQLIQLAVSRKREFLADASGSLLTRYPEGLALALEKIEAENSPLRRANTATAHLYFSNPFGNTKQFLVRIFSTHPPIEERIAELRRMEEAK